MKTSDEYVADLEKVVGAGLEGGAISLTFHWDTAPEGKKLLAQMRQMQRELWHIKRGVNQTIKELRSAFKERSSNVEADLLSTFAGKRRRELRRQQEDELEPFEAIKLAIDSGLLQLDRLKLEVQTWLAENK